MSLHTSLPENRCIRISVKNLGLCIQASDVWEELKTPGIHVQEAMDLFSRRCDRSVKKNHPLTANFVVSVARGSEVPWHVLSPSSPVRDYRWVSTPPRKAWCSANRASGSATHTHTHRNCSYEPWCVAFGETSLG